MDWSRVRRIVGVIGVVALLVAVAIFVAQAFPFLVGADHALVVQSGSMEPAIGTGSIVFVAEDRPEAVEEGDVITYADDGGNLVTHRVVETHVASQSLRFITKGDANDNIDGEPVYRSDYVGEVSFSVPLAGYVVAFGQTWLGWVTLIVVPTVLFVLNEGWELYQAAQTTEKEQ